jgi:hypothetical protein
MSGYLGGKADGDTVPNDWKEYDATSLVSQFDGVPRDILIDQVLCLKLVLLNYYKYFN